MNVCFAVEMRAIKIALKMIHKRQAIYRFSEFYAFHLIPYRKSHDIKSYIHLSITLKHKINKSYCVKSLNTGIKGSEADKAVKQTTDMPGMTAKRLPYTDYYLIIRRARNS